MKNLNMFCLTLEPNHYKFIKELDYLPVGLGEKILMKNGLVINQAKIFQKKIRIMVSTLIIIGFGKTI